MPGPSLADRIDQLSAVEAFSPPASFAAQAQVRDPGDYARAAAEGPAWWAEQARRRLDWDTPFSAVLDDELTGQAVVAYVTLGQGGAGGPALEAELRDHIAGRIGKLARPRQIVWAEDLPKTRSGKIMRRLLRDIAEGREPGDVTTLRDASVLDALQQATSPGGTGTQEKGSTR